MDQTFLTSFQSYQEYNNYVEVLCGNYYLRIAAYSHSIIKINISKEKELKTSSFAIIQPLVSIKFRMYNDDDFLHLSTDEVLIKIKKNPISISFHNHSGKILLEDEERFPYFFEGNKFTNYKKCQPHERYIGLGEKTGNLNRKGSNYVNWNTDDSGYRVNADPLYKTIPFYIGIHDSVVYGLFLDNTHKSFFDFASSTNQEFMWFGAEGGDLNYCFFAGETIPELLSNFTWLTGKMELPPLWSLGYQQCRWSYHPDSQVLQIAKTFREKKIPIDVIYLDIDYMQDYKMFTWSEQEFPNPKQLIDDLEALNIRVVTILDPGIKVENGYQPYEDGILNNYFAKLPNGENYTGEVWPGLCHFPNFFSDDVKLWWGKYISKLSDVGVKGFWNDMNEPAAWGQNLPAIVKFGEYFMPEVRNVYGMQMTQATEAGAKKLLSNERPFVLTRAAYAGIQRHSAVWTGDNVASDEHLLLGQRLINSLGLAGITFTGVDVGGFLGEPSTELMVRWNSLGVYMPMFRNHASTFSKFHEPWEFGPEAEDIMRKDIAWRYQLLPYLYSYFFEATQTGLPICRTLAIYYPFDKNVYDVRFQNQFMFGEFLLVAPAQSFEMEKEVWLPDGNWYRLHSNVIFSGESIYHVNAPLHDLPVFVKESGIIITQNSKQYSSDKGDEVLNIQLYYGEQISEFVYYEDDGITYDYLHKQYYKRTITYNPKSSNLLFNTTEGTYKSMYKQICLQLIGFNDQINCKIILNDNIDHQIIFNQSTQSILFPNYAAQFAISII